MEAIRTGNTTERLVRNGIFTVMVVVFGAYFYYDGTVGYPKDNLKQSVQDLPPEAQSDATINPKVTAAAAQQFEQGGDLKTIEAELGPPTWKGPRANGRLIATWIGPAITMQVFLGAGGERVTNIQLKGAKHSETDLRTQVILGIVLSALGLILVARMVYMFVEGAVLSDAGLKMTAKPLIPFDAMNDWDVSDFSVKGRIKLGYSLNGADGRVVLDDYKLRAFKPIVTAICERTGFANPITTQTQSSEPAGSSPSEQT